MEQPLEPVESDPSPGRAGLTRRLRRSIGRRRKLSEAQFERKFAAQFAQHWNQVRAERRQHDVLAQTPSIAPGPSNFNRAQVPYGVDLAAAWSWRFLVIVAAGYIVARAVSFFSLVVMPVVIAMFVAALTAPVVNVLGRVMNRGAAALLVVLGLIGFVGLMLTFATQQVVQGANNLAAQVVTGIEKIRTWLQTGPLNASESQINNALQQMQALVTTSNEELASQVQAVGATVGHIVAGFFIVLFATYFFLYDGRRIWAWVVRLFPRAARARADESGRVAWLSLTQFVRATVLVALVDAIGIMLVAGILKVPFVMAIGVLVFLGGFVPMVGAAVSGSVAVLVALVAHGPIVALVMLGGVIAVQQLEAHVLQPFLLGKMVSVHPLAVILAIAAGVYLAGIAGALVAVPLVASLNAVVVYLSRELPHEDYVSEVVDSGEAAAAGVRTDPVTPPGR